MNLASTIQLHAGGSGSGCNPDVGQCGRKKTASQKISDKAREEARVDPRQTSLFGPAHEQELQKQAKAKVKGWRKQIADMKEGNK